MGNDNAFESRSTDRAIFNEDSVCSVDSALIERLKSEALSSELGRYRLCMHRSTNEPMQDMIVVHCRGNYSRPHCHPDAAMSFTMIEGRMEVLLFDDHGKVTQRIQLGCLGDSEACAVSLRLAAGVMYMPVCQTETAVFKEVLAAPNPDGAATSYPDWSPADDDSEGIEAFYCQISVEG